MLERNQASRLATYLERKAEFGRRRRKIRLGFEALYRLFAADPSFDRIAKKAGVSKTRIRHIFDQYFGDLLQVGGLERRLRREAERRTRAIACIVRAFRRDPIMRAILKSASKRNRTIEPIIHKMERKASRCFRHRAVLVDGKDIEPVHRIRSARLFRSDGIAYGTTALSRESLEESKWIIFHIDVPSHRRRIIRCRSTKLLKALFPAGVERRDVYIPVDGAPRNPRYDFLADEDNWG